MVMLLWAVTASGHSYMFLEVGVLYFCVAMVYIGKNIVLIKI